MEVFVDFEASSLAKASYPIEVGWVFADGREGGMLIAPPPEWTDWDARAAGVHGLSRERLRNEGVPAADAAVRLVEALSAHALFASAPSWDGKWLSVLLRIGGFPRHLLRLRDSDEAFADAARAAGAQEAAIPSLIAAARALIDAQPVAHRAVADARRERDVWLEVRRLASAPG